MAGLLIKELIVRGDLQRCLVVCPGSLAEQWQDEFYQRFQLPFDILTNDKLEAAPDFRTGQCDRDCQLLWRSREAQGSSERVTGASIRRIGQKIIYIRKPYIRCKDYVIQS